MKKTIVILNKDFKPSFCRVQTEFWAQRNSLVFALQHGHKGTDLYRVHASGKIDKHGRANPCNQLNQSSQVTQFNQSTIESSQPFAINIINQLKQFNQINNCNQCDQSV